MKKIIWWAVIIFSPITLGAFPFVYLESLNLDWFNIKLAFPIYCVVWAYVWAWFDSRGISYI